MSTYSPYPYAPLKPRVALERLSNKATEHGIGLMADAGRPDQSEQTRIDGAASHDLAYRIKADLLQAELGALSAVTR